MHRRLWLVLLKESMVFACLHYMGSLKSVVMSPIYIAIYGGIFVILVCGDFHVYSLVSLLVNRFNARAVFILCWFLLLFILVFVEYLQESAAWCPILQCLWASFFVMQPFNMDICTQQLTHYNKPGLVCTYSYTEQSQWVPCLLHLALYAWQTVLSCHTLCQLFSWQQLYSKVWKKLTTFIVLLCM